MNYRNRFILSIAMMTMPGLAFSDGPPVGEKGNFTVKITQEEIEAAKGNLIVHRKIVDEGMRVFTTPFNRYDGLGDGFTDKTKKKGEPGNRATLQANANEGNSVMLRLNGLDSQTCLECHSIMDNSNIPALFGIGGVGGISASAFPGVSAVDPANSANNNFASYNGRIINPPFVFGSGAVELLAKEMTFNLRKTAKDAREKYIAAMNTAQIAGLKMPEPVKFTLQSHGIDFGEVFWREASDKEIAGFMEKLNDGKDDPDKTNCSMIKAQKPAPTTRFGRREDRANFAGGSEQQSDLMMFIANRHAVFESSSKKRVANIAHKQALNLGEAEKAPPVLVLDTAGLKGVNADLIVKPFGRKGNNVTTRDFDCGAIRFHQGMEPVEIVGATDHDHDGVTHEVTVGQMSALAIFNTTLVPACQAEIVPQDGKDNFVKAGCSDCHKPLLTSKGSVLPFSFPEKPTDPFPEKPFYSVDLADKEYLQLPAFEQDEFSGYVKAGKGIEVRLFSDLRLHDMGKRLQETLVADGVSDRDNRTFITARLWGVADTAPYMHDGRALTLSEAIEWHGGEAAPARTKYFAMEEYERKSILAYLRTLHTPGSYECAQPNDLN